jgi:hypothetical protein
MCARADAGRLNAHFAASSYAFRSDTGMRPTRAPQAAPLRTVAWCRHIGDNDSTKGEGTMRHAPIAVASSVAPAEIGIKGNAHMLMRDENSDRIAEAIRK